MLVRNQYIYLKTTIEENEQKITVSNSIVRLCYKIGVLCLVKLYTSKVPKHDHKALDFIRTDYRAANGKQLSSPLALFCFFLFAPFQHQI